MTVIQDSPTWQDIQDEIEKRFEDSSGVAIGAGKQRSGIRQSAARLSAWNVAGFPGVEIDLPSLPPELTFERLSTYQIINTPLTPDGLIHLYQHTAPLEITYDFTLHYQDEYCENGALDLVRVASLLHALSLPFAAKSAPPTTVSKEKKDKEFSGYTDRIRAAASLIQKGDVAAHKTATDAATSSYRAAIADVPNIELAWPTPCRLEIFRTKGQGKKGVVLHGYVKSAKATFKEPWLQTDNPGSFNLPSSAAYSFTFVNAPNYRNLITSQIAGVGIERDRKEEIKSALAAGPFGGIDFGQGYNDWVRDHFYDVADIAAKQTINTLGVQLLGKGNL